MHIIMHFQELKLHIRIQEFCIGIGSMVFAFKIEVFSPRLHISSLGIGI
jgi:hypothetical protein